MNETKSGLSRRVFMAEIVKFEPPEEDIFSPWRRLVAEDVTFSMAHAIALIERLPPQRQLEVVSLMAQHEVAHVATFADLGLSKESEDAICSHVIENERTHVIKQGRPVPLKEAQKRVEGHAWMLVKALPEAQRHRLLIALSKRFCMIDAE
jgi:hypothetical protein